ncbi:hypothetical protein GF324_05230, partial [bacterium]|nr:hypothetical protein [bacterium]
MKKRDLVWFGFAAWFAFLPLLVQAAPTRLHNPDARPALEVLNRTQISGGM